MKRKTKTPTFEEMSEMISSSNWAELRPCLKKLRKKTLTSFGENRRRLLHLACAQKATPPDIIATIVSSDLDQLETVDMSEKCPLLISLMEGSASTFRILLNQHLIMKGEGICQHRNISPMRLWNKLWDETKPEFRAALAEIYSIQCKNDLIDDLKDSWEKTMCILHLHFTEGKGFPTLGCGNWNVVRSLMKFIFSWPGINASVGGSLLRLALKLYPEQCQWKDDKGELPVHYAILFLSSHPLRYFRFKSDNETQTRSTITDNKNTTIDSNDENSNNKDKSDKEIEMVETNAVALLLSAFPQSASIPNQHGRAPLHEVIVKEKKWNSDIERIVHAVPESLAMRDYKTHLYPFMLAGATDSPLDLIYTLLRMKPETVSCGIRLSSYEVYLEKKVGLFAQQNYGLRKRARLFEMKQDDDGLEEEEGRKTKRMRLGQCPCVCEAGLFLCGLPS